jgi:hypothetical protein
MKRSHAMRLLLAVLLLAAAGAGASARAADRVALDHDARLPAAAFAAGEIRAALTGAGCAVADGPADAGPRIALRLDAAAGLKPQAYVLTVDAGPACTVRASDAAGLLYGGLEAAEQIRLGGGPAGLRAARGEPAIARRGIKFNIPLDARTPSYSDASDSAQQNIPEMWSPEFWRELLDDLARHRYNVLTLWSLHPFPSMVKVPEYPEVALDDVKRTRVPFDDTYDLSGRDMVRPATLKDLETVKSIPLSGKIAFWRDVMRHARDRCIEVHVITWNLFTFGAEGKHGITCDQTNPITLDYFRKSVREMVRTYPDLAGIGVTAGENMKELKGEHGKEPWLWKAYGEGVRDALALEPGRQVRFIHRYHQTALAPVLDAWKNYPGVFDLSFKWAQAHMYASTAPSFAKRSLAELSADRRMWLTVRDDDYYLFRWGDPAFAREFIRAMPGPDKLAGYYIGPDGYTWGREFVGTEPDSPRQTVIRKKWYSFMLWGRLGYDPSLPDALFERTFERRFPGAGKAMHEALARASRILPLVTRLHWENFDFQWYPEACTSHRTYKGFHTVRHFAEGRSMPGEGLMSIKDWAERAAGGKATEGPTPQQVAEAIRGHAAAARGLAAGIDPKGDKELRLTMGDVEAMAHLGDYYAEKILAAADLALFQRTGEAERQASAVRRLEAAVGHWERYAAAVSRQYVPQLLTRLGRVDVRALTEAVKADVSIARGWSR